MPTTSASLASVSLVKFQEPFSIADTVVWSTPVSSSMRRWLWPAASRAALKFLANVARSRSPAGVGWDFIRARTRRGALPASSVIGFANQAFFSLTTQPTPGTAGLQPSLHGFGPSATAPLRQPSTEERKTTAVRKDREKWRRAKSRGPLPESGLCSGSLRSTGLPLSWAESGCRGLAAADAAKMRSPRTS